MKKFFLILVLLALAIGAYSQNNGNASETKIHDLDEVVVNSKNVWIEGDKYVFIPQKREKNLSKNMEDLIDRMHTGVLIVEDGIITTRSGQSVSIFINGVPADNLDKSTFWAKNALRVEYMEFSDDPQFHGAANIVNFIMRDYVAGGLTKLDGAQQFPNNGIYSAASKMVWGKMTYNAMFKGSYSRDHQSGSDMKEDYEGIHYNGSFYENVFRQERSDIIKRSNNLYGGFNVRYRTDKTIVTHSVALQWDEDPGSISQGTVAYSPEIITSDKMIAKSKYHSISPSIDGLYSFIPSSELSLSANWTLSHSHNNNHSSYEDIGLNPIVTLSKENIYNIAAHISALWRPQKNLIFQFAIEESRSISNVDYNGEVSSYQWQNNGRNTFQLLGWWSISSNLTLQVTPQITLYDWNINHDIKKTEWLPGVNAVVGWNINDKNRLNFDIWYYLKNPSPSQRNDLILRSTELKWIEGNPTVNSSSNYWLSVRHNFYPFPWFNNILSFDYITHASDPYLSYRSGGDDYDGVIGQYQNSPTDRSYRASWSFGIDLLNGNLCLGNQLYYNYQRINGNGLESVRTRPYITWYFGNCSLSANYGTPEKFFRQGGTQIVRTSSYFNLDFSYGNGNLIFDFELSSPFNKYLDSTSVCNNGPYHYSSKNWSNGRSISVSLTYTFDYGKKVTPDIDIYEKNIKTSSILSSE